MGERRLLAVLDGAFGSRRKLMPNGMSENPEAIGNGSAIAPYVKPPSRFLNALTGGRAGEAAYEANSNYMDKVNANSFQEKLANLRETGDSDRLRQAHEHAVSLENLRAANDIKKLQADIYEKARPFHLASQYPASKFPDGAPLVIPETDRALVNLGRYGGKNLEEYGQENIGAYSSMQKQKLAQAENLSREEQKYIREATRNKQQALEESVLNQQLGNDKLRVDNAMPRELKAGWNIDKNGRYFTLEEPVVGNSAVPITLTKKTTLPNGKELVDTEEVIRNTMTKTGDYKFTKQDPRPGEIDPVEIANEENARRAEQRLRDMQNKAKERHNPTHDGSPQEEYKGSGGGGGLGTITGLVKKFMKLL